MSDFNSWQQALTSIAGGALAQVAAFIPNLLGSVLVFLLGLLLGNWTKQAVVKSLRFLQLEKILHDTKLQSFLKKAEITQKLEEILGNLVKWSIVLIFSIAAINILGLTTVSSLLAGVLHYVPHILSAVIVLAIGVLLAGLVERLVKGGLSAVDLETSRLMGKISSYAVVTIAALAALSELKIAQEFIQILFIGFVSMLALGFGLAIGLGAKDLIAKLLSDWHKQLLRDLKSKS